MSELGRKDDAGKTPWRLLPWSSLAEVVGVLELGAKKYAVDNWKHVPQAHDRYFDAALRHLTAWFEGERLDPSPAGCISRTPRAASCF